MYKLALTEKGEAPRQRLSREWALHPDVIADLESETGIALPADLIGTIAVLDRVGFEQRIEILRSQGENEKLRYDRC